MGKQHFSDRQGDSDYASDGKFRQRNLIHRQKHSKPEENELIFFEMRMKVREGVASQFNAKSQRCRSRNGTINPAPLPLRAFALNSGFPVHSSNPPNQSCPYVKEHPARPQGRANRARLLHTECVDAIRNCIPPVTNSGDKKNAVGDTALRFSRV